jgi:hypothetical protein
MPSDGFDSPLILALWPKRLQIKIPDDQSGIFTLFLQERYFDRLLSALSSIVYRNVPKLV